MVHCAAFSSPIIELEENVQLAFVDDRSMGDEAHNGDGGAKQASGSGLLQVVWFRQMLHRWQQSSSATADGANNADISTPIDQKQANNNNADDTAAEDASSRNKEPDRLPGRVVVVEERRRGPGAADHHPGTPPSPMTPEPPADVPAGCCAVYVGAERRRFVVPTAYLGLPVFARMLEKAEEEFGFDYHGAGITIPCDTEAFKYILVVMEAHQKGLVDDEGNPKDDSEQAGDASETR